VCECARVERPARSCGTACGTPNISGALPEGSARRALPGLKDRSVVLEAIHGRLDPLDAHGLALW
jgi:hypothetical protein